MSWNDLSMADRTAYIKLGLDNGITDLKSIRNTYNRYAEGGPKKYERVYNLPTVTKTVNRPTSYSDHSYSSDYSYMPTPGSMAGAGVYFPTNQATREGDASFLSAVGNTVGQFIPGVGNYISMVSGIPDLLYDVKDTVKEPNVINIGHTLLDIGSLVAPATKIKYDDIIQYLGIADDAAQSQGTDILQKASDTIENTGKSVMDWGKEKYNKVKTKVKSKLNK